MKAEGVKRWSSFRVLGVRVDAVQIPDVIAQMEHWIMERSSGHFIVAANAHVVMECQHDSALKQAVNAADIVMPDGMPMVLVGRRRGLALKERACGPKLMEEFLACSAGKDYHHFFYGGTAQTLEALSANARKRWPTLQIAGAYSPPFRPLSAPEDSMIGRKLNDAQPDVLWVGLGCPKQEHWMYAHRQRLQVPVMVGVGQAFDILAGAKRPAPQWMRDHGLEWLFRLAQEPKRLWRRYLIQGSSFVYNMLLEELGLKQFD